MPKRPPAVRERSAAYRTRSKSQSTADPAADRPGRPSREDRAVIIQHVLAAMAAMALDDAQQLALLGLSPVARSTLHRYQSGNSVPEAADTLERCANILRIAVALRVLFPEGPGYGLEARPETLGGRSVIATMMESFEGLTRCRRYLEAQMQR